MTVEPGLFNNEAFFIHGFQQGYNESTVTAKAGEYFSRMEPLDACK